MTTYTGGCHCGAVRYSVEIGDLGKPVACNCSRCQKLGALLAFVPRTAFTLEQGAERLTDYRFASGRIAHLFCRDCGIESFAYGAMPDGTEIAAINVNCLDGVEARTIETTFHDGRAA
ncbi:GFA family protein [Frigidibacter sp. MR17.24]|uniref:GFA family protein n=1 Tax=Frigidibacter sp. MR17.24 TaxID=3127345 RepID=UPI003012D744